MKYLVTGGAGYIGSVCVELLMDAGHTVYVIDDLRQGNRNAVEPGATFYEAQYGNRTVLDEIFAQGINGVFHLAAEISVPQSMEHPGPYYETNVSQGINLLEAMREAAETLMRRQRLGVDIFPRGAPEGVTIIRKSRYDCSLYDLLMAYVGQVDRSNEMSITPRPPDILSVEAALRQLSTYLGTMPDWASLEAFLPADLKIGMALRSAVASTFSASLELAKQGRLKLRQGQTFGPIYIKEAEEP